MDFCFLNKDIKNVFPVKDTLIVSNPNKNLEAISSGSKVSYTFPESLISGLNKTGKNSFDNFLKFAVLFLYEKCAAMQLFSQPFSQFAASQDKRNSLTTVSNNFIGFAKTNPLVLTVSFNEFLADLGLHLSSRNRKMLDKALDVIYETSLTVKSTKPSVEIKERMVSSLGKYKKKQRAVCPLDDQRTKFFLVFF